MIDTMPPIYPYVAHAALKHIQSNIQREDVGCLRNAENVLQIVLEKYSRRWNLN